MAAGALTRDDSANTPTRNVFGTLQRLFQWIPPKARLAALVGTIVFVVAGIYTFWWSGSSILNLVCQHNLKSADLTVSVDGKPIYKRKSAEWCRKAVDQCWKMKQNNIRQPERVAASAAYDEARKVYDKIIQDSADK